MKKIDTAQRDSLLVLIILPVGILLMLLVGQLAIRLSPEWQYNADMRSYLDPDSDYLNQPGNSPIEPVLVDILTPPPWIDVFLTPNATYPTRTNSPTPSPTLTPLPSQTEIPVTPTSTPSPTRTIRYPTLTFTPTITPTIPTHTYTPTRTPTPTATPIRYTLTTNIVGNGTVSRNPNQPNYSPGTNMQLTAIPAPGWIFSGWSGALSGSANPATILMDGNKTVTATFTQIQHTLTINIVGSGTVTRNPNQATYPAGTSVLLTANAGTGWIFTNWSGDLGGSTNPETILMDSDKTVTATFTAIEYTLTITIVGSGIVNQNPTQATYHYGDVVQLTADADPNWIFDNWSGNLNSAINPDNITITGNMAVTVTFIPDTTEPDIGPPDGNFYNMNDGSILVIDLGTTIDISGLGEPAYDLVYYESAYTPTEIIMDWVILQISTDQTNWYTIFYWGDYIPDFHSNVSGYTENDDESIPLSALYGILPYKTGIAIDVDGAPGVAVPTPLDATTIPGPVPPGSYRYLRVYALPGGDFDGVNFDSIDVLP